MSLTPVINVHSEKISSRIFEKFEKAPWSHSWDQGTLIHEKNCSRKSRVITLTNVTFNVLGSKSKFKPKSNKLLPNISV